MSVAIDDGGRSRRAAIRAVLDWMDSDATAAALEALDLLALSDEDIERLFMSDARVKRIPFLGRVT